MRFSLLAAWLGEQKILKLNLQYTVCDSDYLHKCFVVIGSKSILTALTVEAMSDYTLQSACSCHCRWSSWRVLSINPSQL